MLSLPILHCLLGHVAPHTLSLVHMTVLYQIRTAVMLARVLSVSVCISFLVFGRLQVSLHDLRNLRKELHQFEHHDDEVFQVCLQPQLSAAGSLPKTQVILGVAFAFTKQKTVGDLD